MFQSAEKQVTIDSLLSVSDILYTTNEMSIERRAKLSVPIASSMIGFLLIVFLWSLQLLQLPHIALGIVFIFLGMTHPRSYSYQINKRQKKIVCKWDGLFGTRIGRTEITKNLEDMQYIKIVRNTNGLGKSDTFQIKLMLGNHFELDLPCTNSLDECRKYANIYQDFLELKTPVRLAG